MKLQLLVYANDLHLPGENTDTITKNMDTLIEEAG
jgi:hypothetical protein